MNGLLLVLILLIVLNIGALVSILWLRRARASSDTAQSTRDQPPVMLICLSGSQQGKQVLFQLSNKISIGRGQENDICLDEPLVSRVHAEVRYENGVFRLEDPGSINGIWIKGKRVMQTELYPGQQFTIGRSVFALVKAGGAIPIPEKIESSRAESAVNALPANPHIADYDVGELIASGSQVTVFRARSRKDPAHGVVVIKYLNNMPYDSDERYFRQKFEQQIVLGTTIRHPFCVKILGGDAQADPPYLIESFLPNGSLETRLRGGQRLRPDEIVTIVGQVCDALAYLHGRGIIHRDVTPSNIMFDTDLNACLIDFGIAHVAATPTATSLGFLLGKARYMSVEQARGDPVVLQSDLYSLGIVAYEMLTGQLPFQGADTDIISRHQTERPTSPRAMVRSLDDKLERAILKALEKEPAKRHANAEEMARAFGYTTPFHAGDTSITGATAIKPGAVYGDAASPSLTLQDVATNKVLMIRDADTTLMRDAIDPNDMRISRRHGHVYFRDNLWWLGELEDAPSMHGLYLNGARVTDPQIISLGDEIRVGKTTLKVME